MMDFAADKASVQRKKVQPNHRGESESTSLPKKKPLPEDPVTIDEFEIEKA